MGQTAFSKGELTVLISALLLAGASLYFLKDLRRVPEWKLLLGSIAFLVLGSVATIVEHAVAYDVFNTIEHACYFAQSAGLLVWALRARKVPA
jgi:hypothetical protein